VVAVDLADAWRSTILSLLYELYLRCCKSPGQNHGENSKTPDDRAQEFAID
jgi:hypothetical protein